MLVCGLLFVGFGFFLVACFAHYLRYAQLATYPDVHTHTYTPSLLPSSHYPSIHRSILTQTPNHAIGDDHNQLHHTNPSNVLHRATAVLFIRIIIITTTTGPKTPTKQTTHGPGPPGCSHAPPGHLHLRHSTRVFPPCAAAIVLVCPWACAVCGAEEFLGAYGKKRLRGIGPQQSSSGTSK